ncbi:MAG: flavodoxin family protein [Candidatus Zixiibacteriota bacterium]
MPRILTLSGSPVKGSSTSILLERIAEGIIYSSPEPVTNEIIRLNDYQYLHCQACGKSPEPDYCLFKDEIYPVYEQFLNCDIILFGSPIYFDTVSAQAKLFIDRCNCLKPYDFENETAHHFKKIITKKRLGAIVLVGGERQKFEHARVVLAGFFKWTEIENCGVIAFAGSNIAPGEVVDNEDKLHEAFALGQLIASRITINGR